jgi:hypothetical protein
MRVFVSLVVVLAVAVSLPLAALTERPSPQPVIVEGGDGGFDWGDAGIGAAAGFGTALVLRGAIALRRMR